MKKYLIGIDAGGTKTAFSLGDGEGHVLASAEGQGGNIYQFSPESIIACFRDGVRELLDASGLERRQIAGVGVGIPIYGESDQADRTIEEICRAAFSGLRYSVVHDGVVGHLGALSGRPGVNVVAGTGSIALGMDAEGHTVRCGGWGHYFSDEGSCYWMGLQAMALFCRQADGRLPKGPLYAIIREKYGLKSDYEFVPLMGRDVMPVRSRVAAQQRLLLEAADAGDGAAVAVYAQAARELAGLAAGAAKQLRFNGPVEVSMTGGALHAMRHLRAFWEDALARQNMFYTEAEGTPTDGALILALKTAERAQE